MANKISSKTVCAPQLIWGVEMHKIYYIFLALIVSSGLWAMEQKKEPYLCFEVEAHDDLINARLTINIKDLVDAWTKLLGDAAKNGAWVAISTTRDQVCILSETAKNTALGAVNNITQSAHDKVHTIAYDAWDFTLWPLRKILSLVINREQALY